MEQRVEQMTWKINFKVSIIVVVLVFSSQVSFSFSSVPWSFFLCWSVFTYSLQFLIFLQWHSWTINQGSEWVNIETQQEKHDSFSQEGILYIFFWTYILYARNHPIVNLTRPQHLKGNIQWGARGLQNAWIMGLIFCLLFYTYLGDQTLIFRVRFHDFKTLLKKKVDKLTWPLELSSTLL